MSKNAVIIGAGPAGLTAAYELLTRTDIKPIILEKSGDIGGISKTINYKGNRMDMGPHRFFSKSDRVMDWWLKMMPLEAGAAMDTSISYQNKTREIHLSDAVLGKPQDKVMLVIQRLTRIYFLRRFFAYPIQLSLDTLRTFGFERTIKILVSFLWARLFPRRPEKNLEDFIINKFGKQLYLLFFKDYTEKVWGKAPSEISADWGAQRIKGVSLGKAIAGAIKTFRKKKGAGDISQKGTETSMIEQFLYPKYGTGSMWEEVARQVEERGGKIYLHQDVRAIRIDSGDINSVETIDTMSGECRTWKGDYFISTMPVQELIAGMGDSVPPAVREVAAGLQYRDFINVGILIKGLSTKAGQRLDLKDNWIYIQERDVKVGRLMIYNNWGGGMVQDPDIVWIGMEYFCNKTDALWFESDEAIQRLAITELEKMDLGRAEDVLDSTVKRMEKTYPAYFGTYERFDTIKNYTDQFANLFLVGRNGMHKYNNADHSMLCSMVAVDNIIAGVTSKVNLWAINTEQEYHEEKTGTMSPSTSPRVSDSFLPGYLWQNPSIRSWWISSLVLFLIEFLVFKLRYPFANYMPDSYAYIEAAAINADVNTWPVAYSKFLRLVSVFTHSDSLLVALQFFFLQVSSMLFVYTLCYFQRPRRKIRNALFLFLILNPVPLFVSNYVSADAVFFGLSLCWFTTLVWLLNRPKPWMLLVHAIFLMLCCTVRYNALYYPIISLGAFLLTRWSWTMKVAGLTLAGGLVLFSMLYTTSKMKTVTGKRQFSAFGGWQLANNALYMYEHVPAAERGPIPSRFAGLEQMVREHMDTLKKVRFTQEDSLNTYFYLWSDKGPLIQYLQRQYRKDSITPYFKRWATLGPLYTDYALYLIRKYPLLFIENFVWPNAQKLAVPPPEFLAIYNMRKDTVQRLAKEWFNYKTVKVAKHNWAAPKISATSWYPVFATLSNVLFMLALFGIVMIGGTAWRAPGLPRLLGLTILFWVTNGVFSVVAAPIVLRYQLLSILVVFCVAILCFDKLFTSANLKIDHA